MLGFVTVQFTEFSLEKLLNFPLNFRNGGASSRLTRTSKTGDLRLASVIKISTFSAPISIRYGFCLLARYNSSREIGKMCYILTTLGRTLEL